ncbi:MAG: alpha-L-rhamnosidase C-terminal domain-containing protein, partial [Ginsengibacter sp.]
PHIGGGFTYASASLDTYYGKVSNSWKIENGDVLMDVEIPANTTATVFIPAANSGAVKESGKLLSQVNDIKVKAAVEGYVEVGLGSGVYHFVVENMGK